MRWIYRIGLLVAMVVRSQTVTAQAEYYPQTAGMVIDSSGLQPLTTSLAKARTLVKLGVSLPLLWQSSFTGYYAMLALDATAERKLWAGLALVAGLQMNAGFTLDGRGAQYYSAEIPVALRYYFSLTRRERQRLDRHSFFSHYVALQTHNLLVSNLSYPLQRSLFDLQRYQRGTIVRTITNSGSVGDRFIWIEYAFLQVGTQHRVFGRYYLDANVVIPVSVLIYNRYEYSLASPPLINLKFGVGKWRK